MLYNTLIEGDHATPHLVIPPDEAELTADIAELYQGVDAWVIQVLKESVAAKDQPASPVELQGEPAIKLHEAVEEAANGIIYRPNFERVTVADELREKARQVIGNTAVSSANPETPDLSPALPDRLIIGGLHKMKDTLTFKRIARSGHTGTHRRQV